MWACCDTAATRLTLPLRFVARHRAGLGRRSAGAETHRLPLLLSSMFPLFSALAEYFASSHDLFFSLRVAAGCHTSAAGGENHKEKQALLFSELRGLALKILRRVLLEHKLWCQR